MRLVIASLLIPFTAYARYRGSLSTNQCDLSSHANLFGPGSFFSLKRLWNEQGRHRSSARNQSAAITVCATDDSLFSNRQGRSRTTLGKHQRDPKSVNNPMKEGMLCLENISYPTRPSA